MAAYGPKPRPTLERFWEKAVPDGDCLLWTAGVDKDGYGIFGLGQGWRTVRAHRFAWEVTHQLPVPAGMKVLHSCDRPACIAPVHLRLGTTADNNCDRGQRGRTSRGEAHYAAKLTAAQVADFRQRHAAGESAYRLGRTFGISYAQAKAIAAGRSWRT